MVDTLCKCYVRQCPLSSIYLIYTILQELTLVQSASNTSICLVEAPGPLPESLSLNPILMYNILIVKSRLLVLSLPSVYFSITNRKRKSGTEKRNIYCFCRFYNERMSNGWALTGSCTVNNDTGFMNSLEFLQIQGSFQAFRLLCLASMLT